MVASGRGSGDGAARPIHGARSAALHAILVLTSAAECL
jgi:hypothetical protein